MVSRSRRLIRFLKVALPSARGVVKPTFGPSSLGLFQQKATKQAHGTLKPWSYTCRNSAGLSSRRSFGKGNRRGTAWTGLIVGVTQGSFVTDGQLVAATRPAASENGAAILRLHALPEAVRLRTLVIIGLKCSLRHAISLRIARLERSVRTRKDILAPDGLNLQYRRAATKVSNRPLQRV